MQMNRRRKLSKRSETEELRERREERCRRECAGELMSDTEEKMF